LNAAQHSVPSDSPPSSLQSPTAVSFGEVSPKNIEQLRSLNLAVFPVKYNEKFYTDLANANTPFTHLGYFSDILVGAICARVEQQEGSRFKLYLMTIGVLAPYRRLGIGGKLLEQTLEACSKAPDCEEIYLHVQVGNDAALEFYKGYGFEVGEVVKDYYTRLDVNDAHIVSKKAPYVTKP
jgi:ribosomal protein S18 acetylase RimI-like enzyme